MCCELFIIKSYFYPYFIESVMLHYDIYISFWKHLCFSFCVYIFFYGYNNIDITDCGCFQTWGEKNQAAVAQSEFSQLTHGDLCC